MNCVQLTSVRQDQTISYTVDGSSCHLGGPDSLIQWFSAAYSDLNREVLAADENIHPVAMAESSSGDTSWFDMLGEISPESHDQLLEDKQAMENEEPIVGDPWSVERQPNFSKDAYIHVRLPLNRPLVSILDEVKRTGNARDIVEFIFHAMIAHQRLHEDVGELHGDLSPNTILCLPNNSDLANLEGDGPRFRGFLWDYEPAREYGLSEFPGFVLNRFMSKLPAEMSNLNITDLMAQLALLGRSE
ncbi:hypothetical protein NEOLEDRAFT_1140578 [Neolentinus lepideus HHB14362 ss-1]|uniref:Fungal-type protein kinase domain-containing protein n=1 Tax=Neolentinus lepideus HHB14362 ss-1 TaxID=1314782 RepID=A0A165P6Q3_9AGAM|nr:hypothetical protein NEOLEDRAFT_1140578 [Neolentinus lepideus HHB14362 ss-1]